jgi:hypothetical protein
MSKGDSLLEKDALNFLWIFPGRFFTFSGVAITFAIHFWPIPISYIIAWFVRPSLLSWIFWAFHAYYFWRDDDIHELWCDLLYAVCGLLPWDKFAFGVINTGIPLTAYVFTTVIYHKALQHPHWTWNILCCYFRADVFALIVALIVWLSLDLPGNKIIKQASALVWQVIMNAATSLISAWVSFCHGRGYFIIFWWRIRERRQDRNFHYMFEQLQSRKWVEDIRDGRSDKPPFQYRSLANERDVRLLELSMGGVRDIKCSMVHVDIDKPGEYSAVSYTWGESTKSHGIVVDGAWLATTASVYEIVFKLAPMHGTRRVWIDFVCINQQDDLEKAKQVQLMGKIYSSANEVVACLNGVDDEFADLTEYFLRKFYKNRGRHAWKSRASRIAAQQKMHQLGVRQPQWLTTTRLLNHAYWSRVWIIQEIANAKNLRILYGDRELPMEAFHHFILSMYNPETHPFLDGAASLDEIKESPIYGVTRIINIFALRQALEADSPQLRSLKDVLSLYGGFNATDKRDFVFGLQGCVREAIDADLLPNYTIRTEELFTRVAGYFLREHDTQSIFEKAGISYHRNLSSLPSWVPDWSCPKVLLSANDQTKGLCQVKVMVESENLSSHKAVLDVSNGVLQLKAIALGSIVELVAIPLIDKLQDIVSGRMDVPSLFGRSGFQNWANICANITQRHSDPYITGETRENALRRMLLGYEEGDEEGKKKATALYAVWEKFLDNVNNTPSDIVAWTDQWISAFIMINSRCSGRAVAVLDKGYMALVPQGAKVDDQIYLIAGNSVPYVFRDDCYYPSSPILSKIRRSPHYRLVGDSYIHGLTADDKRIAHGIFQTIKLF